MMRKCVIENGGYLCYTHRQTYIHCRGKAGVVRTSAMDTEQTNGGILVKRFLAIILAFAMILSVSALTAHADEAETIEQDGFVCERLRNGNLKLVRYTCPADGNTVNIPSAINGSHIERIGEYAFDGCRMSNVTIPDTVKMIESFAFNDCSEIQRISIPNDVYFIDGNPFTGCTKLVNISLDPKHPTLQVTSDGVLYSKRNKMLLCYPCSKTERNFSVMSGTITIGKNAFFGCEQLQSINLPSTVKGISDGAFQGCTGLISVTLPESLLTIGELAFAGCTALKGVSIPSQVSRVEKSAFFNCTELTNVSFPENLTAIEDMAFFGCRQLQEIHLPASVASIGDKAFFGCASLTDAYIPVSVTEIGDSAFENCSVRLYMHLDEFAYAEIYARLYEISFTYGNEDSFLTGE